MNDPDSLRLRGLPTAARVLLTAFLLLITAGYLAALGNLYHRHELADEREGLTFSDLRAHFHGLDAEPANDTGASAALPPSRMLQMVQPGGEMRKHLTKGGPPAVRALTGWLRGGALDEHFSLADRPQPDDPSPKAVLQRHCLRCHNAENGEKQDAPYGPDMFTVEYRMVYQYAAPGTAPPAAPVDTSEATQVSTDPNGGIPALERRIGLQSLGHLLLVTHIHMLAMPVYTLILGGLFLLTSLPKSFRSLIAIMPMAALICDFSCWWLSRFIEPLLYLIPAAGMVYGGGIAIQILCIFGSMWLGRRPRS
ncbi:MAG: hypothetical protein ACYSUI_07410 [Planctomycetota bacterium]